MVSQMAGLELVGPHLRVAMVCKLNPHLPLKPSSKLQPGSTLVMPGNQESRAIAIKAGTAAPPPLELVSRAVLKER